MIKYAEFRGQITVFLGLILTVVLSLILGTVESARISALRAQAERSLYLAQESVLASYNIPLKEWYHVFAVDGGETPGDMDMSVAEGILSDYAKRNFPSGGLFGGEFSNIKINTVTLLTDYELRPLKKQISEYMGQMLGKEAIQNLWTSLVSGGENLEAVRESQLQQIESANQEAKDEESNYTDNGKQETDPGVLEGQDTQDPRRGLQDILKAGVLKLVVGDNFDISQKSLDPGKMSFSVREELPVHALDDFEEADTFKEEFDTYEQLPIFSEILNQGAEKLLIVEYASRFFRSAVPCEISDHESALAYELEYLLFGHSKDVDNLASSVNKIIIIRMLFNIMYLMRDAEKKMEAREIAVTLALSIAMPFLEGIIYLLILMAWSYAEGILDCRSLISNEKVPLTKTASSWKTSLINLAGGILEDGSQQQESKGLRYTDYLKLLLALENEDKVCYRMLNIMEANIRLKEGYDGFCVTNCIYGFQYEADYCIPGFFGRQREYHFNRKYATCY